MKKNTCGYAGKIANVGSQRVEAPCAKAAPAPKGNVRYSGNDLRTGTSGGTAKKKTVCGAKTPLPQLVD